MATRTVFRVSQFSPYAIRHTHGPSANRQHRASIRAHRRADRPVLRWPRVGARFIEPCEPALKNLWVARLSVSIERHEHGIIAVPAARTMEDDKRAAAI